MAYNIGVNVSLKLKIILVSKYINRQQKYPISLEMRGCILNTHLLQWNTTLRVTVYNDVEYPCDAVHVNNGIYMEEC